MKPDEIRQALNDLDDERNGAVLYRALSGIEKNPQISEIYRRMAEVEDRHAAAWAKRLEEAGAPTPPFHPSWRTRALIWVARRFGVGAVLPSLTATEQKANRAYRGQPAAKEMVADEGSHARLLSRIIRTSPAGLGGSEVAQLEGRHRASGGNALRAAVLGANDGLVSNMSLVMGVIGAQVSNRTLLITGLAGLLAGASSMAIGEWLSVQSSRELYKHQIEIETQEVETAPQEEAEELALIYQARGIERQQALDLANRIMEDRASAVETLVREELSVDTEELGGSAWQAAITSFLLFTVGAIIPVLPHIFMTGTSATLVSIAVSLVGLFIIGAGITLFTGRSVIFSGTRQVVFGLATAGITFGIGRLIGVSIGG